MGGWFLFAKHPFDIIMSQVGCSTARFPKKCIDTPKGIFLAMEEIPTSQVAICDPFWTPRLLTNAHTAIFHQWQQLEASRCIDNFRIAAGLKKGFREGWFFADSDAYKWLDAAARIYSSGPAEDLKARMDAFLSLVERTQMEDGYLFTYNQIHFPDERWDNLMIEHELYCHGHLIEAAISHFQATNNPASLTIARKAADLLVRDFLTATVDKTSGHEEIEIALMRLYLVTGHKPYVDLAKQFLERRGRVRPFAPLIIQQNDRVEKRSKFVREQRRAYLAHNPDQSSFQLPPANYAKRPFSAKPRSLLSILNGQFFQQHAPIRSQTVPVGHAVRFGYLETAIAMLYRIAPDQTLLPAMEKAWENMVAHRMYVTGGIGSLPEMEGFGRDDELDPEVAYAETCAALASLFWNWQMVLIHAEAKFSDLFEWQLYNAAAVGMGLGGDSYLYNNPLLCREGITRRSWFQVPCCPSNLSRTWASLGKFIYSWDEDELWIHQYIGNEMNLGTEPWKKVKLASSLPWEGKVRIIFQPEQPVDFTLHLRIPSWVGDASLRVNGSSVVVPSSNNIPPAPPASGYDPRLSRYATLHRRWSLDDIVDLEFEIPIVLRKASPHLRGHKNKVALTRGPLVYCLESTDNPGLDIFRTRIDPDFDPHAMGPTLAGRHSSLAWKNERRGGFHSHPLPIVGQPGRIENDGMGQYVATQWILKHGLLNFLNRSNFALNSCGWIMVPIQDSEERGAEVTLRPVRQNGRHIAWNPGGQLPGCPDVGPRANAHQQAVFLAQPPGGGNRIVVGNLHHLVHQGKIENGRHKTIADALNLMQAGFMTQNGGDVLGLNRYHADFWVLFF